MKLTLRAARVNAGYTLVEASREFGINKDTLSKYEKDSTNIPRSLIVKIEDVYAIPTSEIFFGIESEFFRKLMTYKKEGA